ncbi:hypothetical protein [Streptomyces sp. NRRL F-5126]|uniref:hypothetical protein n=1 Tax=Streptomyces sp. NRRL F-5126 TaxID=1463857 RepID=UPI000B2109A2|nr:hypothetical protein [Streptomyces sp. NRRL F-5126]
MREVARRAGLGVATVHRHLRARTDLVTAAFADLVAECREDMRARLDEALFASHPAAAAPAADRRAPARALEQLVERAREAAAARADVTVEGVRVCLGAIASFRLAHPPGTCGDWSNSC